MGVGTSVF